MAFTINDPKFIDSGGFVGWTVGTNGAFVPTDLPPDNHGATGTWLSAGTGTDEETGDGCFTGGCPGQSATSQIHRS